MIISWCAGLLRRRLPEVAVSAVSIALAVAFVAALGSFDEGSRNQLTERAAASVPVDWQVQVTTQGQPDEIATKIRSLPGLRSAEPVAFAKVDGFQTSGPQGTRKTGTAYVVGLSPSYLSAFPREVRGLIGLGPSGTTPADRGRGVQLFQQTAANLAATPGTAVQIVSGRRVRTVEIDAVVDLPAADSFFQVVGLSAGAGASAPPDNVILVPMARFADLAGSASVIRQFHVGFDHQNLPADPQQAAVAVQESANRFQADAAGGALVADNLETVLTAAGEDASYANLLFLLLGLPGLVLAMFVVWSVAALRADRRRRELGLLRLRGASSRQILTLVSAEAALSAVFGVCAGLVLAVLAVRLALPPGTVVSPRWAVAAGVVGLLAAVLTQGLPAVAGLLGRRGTIDASTRALPALGRPWPLRIGLDALLLIAAGTAFAFTARDGYQVVLAPEGIPQTQVNYAALIGPLLAWPGLTLLVWRLTLWTAARQARMVRTARPGGRGPRSGAPELEAAAVSRRRHLIGRGAVGLAAAVGLALSTAVFTATYQTQARVDVALTVGSDVAVIEPPGSSTSPRAGDSFTAMPGVTAVEPLQHRFAYVGADLQDLYGVRADTLAAVAPLQDAFVPGSTVAQILTALRSTPDGVLLSAETLNDYQLHPGDLIRLRLQTGADKRYRPVDFHVIGQVSEWPTAPKDSFIVANAEYVKQATGSDAVAVFLISTPSPSSTAATIRSRLLQSNSAAQVSDTTRAAASVTSATGLAASDLSGLSRLELAFGIGFAIACSALALLAGIVERRRALVLLTALGADARQRRRFLSREATVMVSCGLAGGLVIGSILALLLVKVLNGIFDPPPAWPTVPWAYAVGLLLAVASTTVGAVWFASRLMTRTGPSDLRDL